MKQTEKFNHSINSSVNIKQLEQEIMDKYPIFYTLDFNQSINKKDDSEKISYADFWKLAKIKAKKASLFVDQILSCEVIEPAPMGFIREITMAANDVTQGSQDNVIRIKERVVIDEKSKTIFFFQLESTGKILLYAINQVIEKNDNIYFVGHYVYNIQKNSKNLEDQAFMQNSEEAFPARVELMVNRMKNFAKMGNLQQTYQKFYE